MDILRIEVLTQIIATVSSELDHLEKGGQVQKFADIVQVQGDATSVAVHEHCVKDLVVLALVNCHTLSCTFVNLQSSIKPRTACSQNTSMSWKIATTNSQE